MKEEYKYVFFKTELDDVLNSSLEFQEKKDKFFDIIEMLVFDALLLLSEIKYYYKGRDNFEEIFPKIISKLHYKYYVWGGQYFDEKNDESNTHLSEFYKNLNEKENRLFLKFKEFIYIFEQDYRVWVLYWFDNDISNIEKFCKEMLLKKGIEKDPFEWLRVEVINVQEKLLKVVTELHEIRK